MTVYRPGHELKVGNVKYNTSSVMEGVIRIKYYDNYSTYNIMINIIRTILW